MGKKIKKIALLGFAFLFGILIIINSYGEKKINQDTQNFSNSTKSNSLN